MASAYMFSHYWPGDGQQGEPPAAAVKWQSIAAIGATTTLFLLAPAPVGIAALFPLFIWQSALAWLWVRLPVRYRLLWEVHRLLGSPEFVEATAAVHIAASQSLRDRRAWGQIGQRVGAIPGVGENVFRHLLATEQIADRRFGHLYRRNLLLELAWFSVREKLG